MSAVGLTEAMTPATLTNATAEGLTEQVDPIACLDERTISHANESGVVAPGRYIEVQGRERTLLIPLGEDVQHIGRGLAADIHLDESSVSRRHAIVVPRSNGARILDDRSSNGTLVNGRRVQQADLCDGDVIVLGRVVLRYLEI